MFNFKGVTAVLGVEGERVVFQHLPSENSFLRNCWFWERPGMTEMPQRESDL